MSDEILALLIVTYAAIRGVAAFLSVNPDNYACSLDYLAAIEQAFEGEISDSQSLDN